MNPLKSILAATDFSGDARSAVARAARVAAERQAELSLLHVMSGPAFSFLRDWLHPAMEVEEKLVEDVRRTLEELAAQVAGECRIVATPRMRVGGVLDEILSAAAESDLLALGARGLNPMRDLILGTTAERVLTKCTRPVLVAKRAPQGAYRRLLVPVDFSPHSAAALRAAVMIAPQAEIDVFHAFEVPFEGKLRFAGVSDEEIQRYGARTRQQAVANMDSLISAAGMAPHQVVRSVAHGSASRRILEKELESDADLIVIGKHGKSVIEELFLGSVTRHVLSDAKCDVLVVQDEKPAG